VHRVDIEAWSCCPTLGFDRELPPVPLSDEITIVDLPIHRPAVADQMALEDRDDATFVSSHRQSLPAA
jgi:hypothetical protein